MTSILTAITDGLRSLINTSPISSPTPPVVSRPWTTHDANQTLHHCLSTPTPTKPALPTELILQILNHPTRFLHVTSVHITAPAANEPLTCSSAGPEHGNWRILATAPLPAHTLANLRILVYSFNSQDQGWSGYPQHHGTYDASWTWFEAGLTRFEGQVEESRSEQEVRVEKERGRCVLQRNRHAAEEPEGYRIELGGDHELVRRAEAGDRFALWVRAMYPGWTNRVHYARIDVWCVDDLAEV